MIFKDYYKILGLENNKVNIEEIKIAFREQAKKYHPDVNTDSRAEERFKDINEAYRVLTNHTQKRKYDRIWYSHVGKKKEREERKNNTQKNDFIGILFGHTSNKKEEMHTRGKKIPVKGENIETEIDVSIEEAYYGRQKKISLRAMDGKMKNFGVKIPAGIRNGEKIRLIGQGKAGENGGKSGDLFIKVHIEDNSKFQLKGYDIYTDVLLTPWEAVLGAKVTVASIEDEASIYLPQGIESGEKVKIPGKGYKDGKGGRGDLVAQVKIVVPKQIGEEEKALYEKLKEISNFEPRTKTLT